MNRKKKNNKILIKNLPVFGILSKQEAAADSLPDGDEAERKQRGQIMENQDEDGKRWRHFHWSPVCLHKNNEKPANWVSRK